MAIKIELKIPGTDVGMSLEMGHLEGKAQRDKPKPEPEPEESECECGACASEARDEKGKAQADGARSEPKGVASKSTHIGKREDYEADIVTKMFTSLIKCTASNVNLHSDLRNKKRSSDGGKGKKNRSAYYDDDEEDSLARGLFTEGCSSDFSVSQSLYPDDILVSYEPTRRKKTTALGKHGRSALENSAERRSHSPAPGAGSDNTASSKSLKEVKIVPINRSTNAKILPNSKFREAEKSRYDVSCISVPVFCSPSKCTRSYFDTKGHGITDPCRAYEDRRVAEPRREGAEDRSYTKLLHKKNPLGCGPVYSDGGDEDTLISVPSSIYTDNILLTIKTHKHKQKKKKKRAG